MPVTRCLMNCLTNFEQTWQAHAMIKAHFVAAAATGMQSRNVRIRVCKLFERLRMDTDAKFVQLRTRMRTRPIEVTITQQCSDFL